MLDYAIGLRKTPGLLELHGGPARLSIQQQGPALAVRTPPVRLDFSSTPPQLQIDSTQSRADTGYYTYLAFISQNRQHSTQAGAEAVAGIVAAGEAYAAVERGDKAILTQDTGPEPAPDWELAFKPLTPPSISYTPGHLQRSIGDRDPDIQVSSRPPIIEIQAVPTRVSYTPSTLRIFLRPVTGTLGDLLDLSA
jgi:hypothetical protein